MQTLLMQAPLGTEFIYLMYLFFFIKDQQILIKPWYLIFIFIRCILSLQLKIQNKTPVDGFNWNEIDCLKLERNSIVC